MVRKRFKLISAVYLLLRRGDDILLSQRANTGYQDGKYSVVAGHLEGNELATAALRREAQEEAGIEVLPEDMRLVHTAHRLHREDSGNERLDLFFEARRWSGEVRNMEPEKCSELTWFPVSSLPPLIVPLVRKVIEKIQQGEPYSEYESEP